MSGLECGDVFAKLSEYLDGELPEDICAKMHQHIGDCEPCVEFVESLRKSSELLKGGLPVEGPGPLSEECREALWKAFRERA
jgi:anti-sigma factor RsiW